MIIDGDYDVFGDGSVVIKSAPGHTPGHQVLFVRLPSRGPVMLSGDMVHLHYSWETAWCRRSTSTSSRAAAASTR